MVPFDQPEASLAMLNRWTGAEFWKSNTEVDEEL
jgi:carboxypeptidase C (cathepsin A)